jgi:ABC-type antimicrobial peptide transport system permease subunit
MGFVDLWLLTCVGLYGLVAWSVVSRTREIGLRMALGADRLGVLRMILGQVAVTAAAGLAVGVPATLALSYRAVAALRHRGARPGGHPGCRRRRDGGGPAGGVLPGAPDHAHRPRPRAPVRITRSVQRFEELAGGRVDEHGQTGSPQ